MRAYLLVAAAVTLLAGCNEGETTVATPPALSTPQPTTGTQTGLGFDVSPCLNQMVGDRTVAGLVVPDAIRIRLEQAPGFPNGRRLEDPVADITLAALFLDLTKHPATTLAAVPVNPPTNDVPFLTTFPYAAPPQGNPPLPAPGGANFNFRTDPASAFVQVDRTGMPAVSAALISSAVKNPFNDASPADDVTGRFVPDILTSLASLTLGLADDFDRLGLTKCAQPF